MRGRVILDSLRTAGAATVFVAGVTLFAQERHQSQLRRMKAEARHDEIEQAIEDRARLYEVESVLQTDDPVAFAAYEAAKNEAKELVEATSDPVEPLRNHTTDRKRFNRESVDASIRKDKEVKVATKLLLFKANPEAAQAFKEAALKVENNMNITKLTSNKV